MESVKTSWTKADYDTLNTRSLEILRKITSTREYPKFSIDQMAGHVSFGKWICESNGINVVPPDEFTIYYDRGAVAQFKDWRNGLSGPFFYCCIPNLKAEQYYKGGNFDIGTERVFPDISDGNLETMLKAGLDYIYAVSEDHGVNAGGAV